MEAAVMPMPPHAGPQRRWQGWLPQGCHQLGGGCPLKFSSVPGACLVQVCRTADCCLSLSGSSRHQLPARLCLTCPSTSILCPFQVRRTQTAGLVATGAAVGYYFISPSLRVEEIRVPSSSLLATAPMFGIGEGVWGSCEQLL